MWVKFVSSLRQHSSKERVKQSIRKYLRNWSISCWLKRLRLRSLYGYDCCYVVSGAWGSRARVVGVIAIQSANTISLIASIMDPAHHMPMPSKRLPTGRNPVKTDSKIQATDTADVKQP